MIQYRVMILMFSVLFGSMYAKPLVAEEKQDINTAADEASSKTHGLLIFLDDTEAASRNGAIQMSLLTAIIEQACPIIASASILINIKENLLKERIFDEKELLEKIPDYSEQEKLPLYKNEFFRSILVPI